MDVVLYNFNVLNVNHYGHDHYLEWNVLMVVFVYIFNAIHGFVFFFFWGGGGVDKFI